MNDELMERLARALANSQARDDEGEYERLADLIGFSGENKLWTVLRTAVQAILSELSAAGFVVVPEVPSDGLLISMAIRYDHRLGVPGYYDQPVFGASGCSHADRLESIVRTMRQLHEEVVGAGFYRPEREQEYAMLKARPV